MRPSLPVTMREHEIEDGTTLMSTTDLQSHITYANAAFVQVSGYDASELLAQPHNVLRHPDMPKEAFGDMWRTLKEGHAWTALVKNRRKNGDHYWVRANASPIIKDGQAVGYISVRTKPARDEVAAADALYRRFREGKAGGLRFRQGLVVRSGWLTWLSALPLMSTAWRLRLGVLLAALPGGLALLFTGAAPWTLAVPVLAAAVAMLWLHGQVARPLDVIRRDAELVACGQAARHALPMRSDDIGMLARAVNQSGLNLRSLLDDVSLQVGKVREASEEIAQGNVDLSARTEQSAASLEESAASMAQLNATVGSNSERARTVEAIARQTRMATDQGKSEFSRLAATMQDIQRSSERIADINALIDGIAFQTNILALNAAVEAARAAEHGRGFAVVAAEVRNLAQRSAAAAKDIKGLIEDSVRLVSDGAALVGRVDGTMSGIAQSVQQVSGLIEEVRVASDEQAMGISQMDAAINLLDQSTQQNAALVEKGAAAAVGLQERAARLADAVRAFRS